MSVSVWRDNPVLRGFMLALALPACVVGGLLASLAFGMTVGNLFPEMASIFIWLSGLTLAAVATWFLVRATVRVGQWRSLVLGLVGSGLVAAASYALGAATQAVDPGVNGMAGTAWIALAYVLAIYILLAAGMGAVAIRIENAAADRRDEG